MAAMRCYHHVICAGILTVAPSGCRTTQAQVASTKRMPLAVDRGLNGTHPAWLQLGPNGVIIAKALADGPTCPDLTVDGAALPMSPRSTTPVQDFGILVCQVEVPATAASVALGDQALKLPVKSPQKILVLGDTGCEIKAENGKVAVQDCNHASNTKDPKAWGFPAVAAAAATEKPDLIIHVGDYHYREVACPTINADQCGGAFVGDTWPSWNQDFFTPVLPLLGTAPWIFARGNHELCSRAGKGWFYFLDPHGYTGACVDQLDALTDPYLVPVGEHTIAVIDSANDKNIRPSLAKLPQITASILWVVEHRPFLTPGIDDEASGPTPLLPDTLKDPGKLGAVIAGHAHRLDLNVFKNANPPELISGNGGTTLESDKRAGGQVISTIDSPDGYRAYQFFDYGYMTLEKQSLGSWNLLVHDRASKVIFNCQLTEGVGVQTGLTCI